MQKQFLDNTGVAELLNELGQYLKGKQDVLVSGTNIKTINNTSLLGSGNIEFTASDIEVANGDTVLDSLDSLTNSKQNTLVSGTSIKTINNTSLLGSGNISVQPTLVSGTNIKTINGQHIIGSGNLVLTSEDIKDSYGNTIQESLDGKQDTLTSGTNIKTINGITLLGSGNIVLDGSNLDYTGEERYNLHASETIDQSLDNLDTAIHDLDSIVGEEILTPTIVEHSYIVRDPAASRGNLATSNPWRVEVFKGLSEGENLLVSYSGTDTSSSAQVAGWYSDGDNLINTNYSYISNLNGYAQNIVGKTYLITVPNSTVKALALSLHTNVQAEVKRIGRIQAEIHGIENPNGIESISTTESSVSGGNNTVTITETDGTTTTFNVKNGTDGVSLGEVALVQTTGDSEESVMSQKAVTEYGRKVTAADLAGTSDWIKAKLTEEGWEFDKYISNSGGLGNATGYCVSPYIPINGVEGKNIWFYGGEFTSGSYCTCIYNSNKTKLTNLAYTEKPRKYSFGSYSTSIAYIRTTFKISDIAKCYVYNNTNGKYLFKMEEYLVGLFNENGLNVSSKFLEEDIIKQEVGESTIKTMSQKAITNAINYNINIQHGKGINTAQDWTWLKLTPKAVSLLNASEKMTFMFSTRGTGNSQDYRYFGFGSSSTSKANTWDADGAWLYWSYSANLGCKQKDYNLNLYNSKRPTPDVWIVTWDRVTGTVSFYDRTTKLTTLTSDNYKCDHFVNANGTIILKTGDNKARIYDIRLFDYDISVLFGSSNIAQEIKYLDGAGTPPSQFDGNYAVANNDSSFNSVVNSFQGGGYAATCTYTLDGSDYHIVVKDGVTSSQVCGGKPYYLGRDYKAQINILNFEVVSGVIKTSYDGHTTSILYKITDSNGDEIEDYNNIGVGTYTLTRSSFGPGGRLDFYKVSGDVEVVINSTCYYKPISCVFHLKCNTLYNNMLYDEQTDEFYKIYTNYACTTESTAHVMVDTPLRVVRDNIASGGLPHYRGEMAVYNGNVYIGMPDYTWKQINNS